MLIPTAGCCWRPAAVPAGCLLRLGETCYYRTLEDYRTVRSWTGQGARIGIIGGGFIGSEIAAALASNGRKP